MSCFSYVAFFKLKETTENSKLNLEDEYSVTRFGENSPLWHNFKSIGQNSQGLFSIWQNFDRTLAKMFYYLANFHYCRWPNTFK